MLGDDVLVGAIVAAGIGVAVGASVGVSEAVGVTVAAGVGVGIFVGVSAAVGAAVGARVGACAAVGAGVGVAPQAARARLTLKAHRLKDRRRSNPRGVSRAIKGVSVQVMKNMIISRSNRGRNQRRWGSLYETANRRRQ